MKKTFDRMKASALRNSDTQSEHSIQCACIRAFRRLHPYHAQSLFAIPNGGAREAVTGRMLKDEGVMAGVADLFFMEPRFDRRPGKGLIDELHGLFIEMKRPKGRQSEAQKRFEKLALQNGYQYVICHSVDEFLKEIGDYMCGYEPCNPDHYMDYNDDDCGIHCGAGDDDCENEEEDDYGDEE